MFQPARSQVTMIDSKRGYSWRGVGTTAKGLVTIAALTVDGREIPYEYSVDPQFGESGEWYEITLRSFGSSIVGEIQHGLTRVDFDSGAEREKAVLVAIEATLAWEPDGHGLERPDGYCRVLHKGLHFRLSDFGQYSSGRVGNA